MDFNVWQFWGPSKNLGRLILGGTFSPGGKIFGDTQGFLQKKRGAPFKKVWGFWEVNIKETSLFGGYRRARVYG